MSLDFTTLIKPTGLMPLNALLPLIIGEYKRKDIPQSQIIIKQKYTGTFSHGLSQTNIKNGSEFQHHIYSPRYKEVINPDNSCIYKTIAYYLPTFAVGYTFDLTDFRLNKPFNLENLVCVCLFFHGIDIGQLPISDFEDKGDYFKINLFKNSPELVHWSYYHHFGLNFYFKSDSPDDVITNLNIGLSWIKNRETPPSTELLETPILLKAENENNILRQNSGMICPEYIYNYHKIERDVNIESKSFWVETDSLGQSWILSDEQERIESYNENIFMQKMIECNNSNDVSVESSS